MGSKSEKIKNFFLMLLSHHSEEYYNRTFTLSFRGKEIHFCARCSGVILIFFMAVCFELLANLKVDPTLSLVLAIIMVIPVLIDWGTQKLGYRESRNVIRFTTGGLLGVAISLLQYAYTLRVLTIIAISIYLVIAIVISMKGY